MKRNGRLASYIFVLFFLLTSCKGNDDPFLATFDEVGSWDTGEIADVDGKVADGVYQMHVKADIGMFWATAGNLAFSDGQYGVQAVQLSGPLDNGYGMIFRVDHETDSFYLFKVSGDGYVSISRCIQGCAEEQFLVDTSWFESEAVLAGLNQMNQLMVMAEGQNLIFYVNDIEVGRITDASGGLKEGDIGIVVESLGQGNIKVAFDNFVVDPIEK